MTKSISILIFTVLFSVMTFAQNAEIVTFGVRGNCGMCETTIEKAAKSVEGVSDADWDKESKIISVNFDKNKTSLDDIHKAIAKSGYDTERMKAEDSDYNNLHGCCQYDREMKISTTKAAAKSCCAGEKKGGCNMKMATKE